jgi:uncharacterized protein (DUF58 family)
MIDPKILAKIRQLNITIRKLLSGSLIGDSRSAQKGTGFEFDQIREYQVGDDVRFIDWNASSRSQTLLVKQYRPERSRTIFLAVDVSGSVKTTDKHEQIRELTTILAFVATYGNDRVALVLFANEVKLYVPPQRGWPAVHKMIRALFDYNSFSGTTQCSAAAEFIASLPQKDAIVFFVSDFIDDTLDKRFALLSKKTEVIAVRCLSDRERSMPRQGIITMRDVETGQDMVIDLAVMDKHLAQRIELQNVFFKLQGIDIFDVAGSAYLNSLVLFFARRMRY